MITEWTIGANAQLQRYLNDGLILNWASAGAVLIAVANFNTKPRVHSLATKPRPYSLTTKLRPYSFITKSRV